MWTKTQNSFNAGELSPYLQQRPDITKYQSGCDQLENFIILPYGGVYRRPGTRYVGSTKDEGKVRLIPFNFSTEDSFALEFGDNYIRFHKSGHPVLNGTTPYELSSPWSGDQLREIQFTQVNDVLFLVHKDVPPRKLSRTDDTNWSLDEFFVVEKELRDSTVYPPFRDQNTDRDKTVALTSATYPAWVTATEYPLDSTMSVDGVPYRCVFGHISGATPLTAIAKGYWRHIGWDGVNETYDQVTVESNFDLFGSELGQVGVGSYMQLSYKRPATSISFDLLANTTLAPDPPYSGKLINTNIISGVFGRYTVRTYGIWSGTIKVQRAYDVAPVAADGWETVAEFVGKSDRNVDSEAVETRSNAFYRIVVEDYAVSSPAGSYTPRVVLEVQDQYVPGLVEVVSVSGLRTAQVKCYNMIYSAEPTDRWRIGSWSEENGYPATVCLHESRIFFGGSRTEPQTVWGSIIDSFENFLPGGTEDSDHIQLTIASGEQNDIEWLVSRKKLVMGTSGAEWTLGSSDDDIAITPTNVVAKRHSSFGSKHLQGIAVNEVVFFAQRNGRKVREFTYSFENDGYVAPDLTRLAEHVTAGGIVEWGYQQQRDQILWAVTGEGALIGFTYERMDDVLGWHRHTTYQGEFESVCVTYGDRENDQVWVVVRREINGSTVRFVEMIDPQTWDYDKAGVNRSHLRYCDASVLRRTNLTWGDQDLYFGDEELFWGAYAGSGSDGQYLTTDDGTVITDDLGNPITIVDPDGSPTTFSEIVNLEHLEGETVCITVDGAKHQPLVVTGGAVTLLAAATDVVVGLPYASTVKSLPLVTPASAGTSQGRTRKVHELVLNVYQSSGGQFAPGDDNYDTIPYRDTGDLMDSPPPLFTGDIQIKLHGGWNQDGVWTLQQTDPYPMTLRAATTKYNAGNP